MPKRLFLMLLNLCLYFLQAQNMWLVQGDYRYGGTGDETVHAIHRTADDGYIVGGYSFSGIGGDKTEGGRGYPIAGS